MLSHPLAPGVTRDLCGIQVTLDLTPRDCDGANYLIAGVGLTGGHHEYSELTVTNNYRASPLRRRCNGKYAMSL